jgi:hypothetical protein
MLDATSRLARVNYYGCERCGLVWNEPKTADELLDVIPPSSERPKDRPKD